MTDRILILDFGSQVTQLIADGLDEGVADVAYGWRLSDLVESGSAFRAGRGGGR